MGSNYLIRIVAIVSVATSVATSIVTLVLFFKGQAQLSSEFSNDDHVKAGNVNGHKCDEGEEIDIDKFHKMDEGLWLQSVLKSSAFVACVSLLQIVNSSILLASSTLQSREPVPVTIVGESEVIRTKHRPMPVSWTVMTLTGVIVALFCFASPRLYPHKHFNSTAHLDERLPVQRCSDSGSGSGFVSHPLNQETKDGDSLAKKIEMGRDRYQKYFIITAVYLFVHALEILILAIYANGVKRSPKCSYSYCCGTHSNGYKLFIV